MIILKVVPGSPATSAGEIIQNILGGLSELHLLIDEVGAMQRTAEARMKSIRQLQAQMKPKLALFDLKIRFGWIWDARKGV